VTLSSSTAAQPTFTAPTGPVTLEFELTVDDTFNASAPASVFVNVNGIAGLDFATQLSGEVKGETAKSPFTVTVTNNGVLTRTITSGSLVVGITRNGTPVPASEYVVASKSVSIPAGVSKTFTLTWNHGTAQLHAGDDVSVSVCANQLGDSQPGNNCGVIDDPAGPVKVFAWPKAGGVIRSSATSNSLATYITNISSFTVRPIRVAENMSVTVSVNGGPAQPTVAPATAPFALKPDLGTKELAFVWNHAPLAKGSSVEITACALISTNQAVPTCWSKTITVT
jgi:hypothetical protein